MISVISVTLTRGELSRSSHLHDLADLIYSQQVPLQPNNSSQGLQTRVSSMVHASVYTCVPQPGSQAAFMYLNARQFEIIIETSNQGHLIRSSESVVRELRHQLSHKGMKADIDVSFLEPNDNQTYINGTPTSLPERLWSELKFKIVAVVIYFIMIGISSIWLVQFFQEAVAVLIGFLLFTLWDIIVIIARGRKQSVEWRIHE